MASKKENTGRSGVSHDKREAARRVVLVGTYKGDQLTKWRGWYNYPISDDDLAAKSAKGTKVGRDDPIAPQSSANLSTSQPFNLSTFQRVNELWLFNGTKDERRYKADFVGIKTREELIRDYGYPAKGKAHGDKYLLFKTAYMYRHSGAVPGDAERVIIRTADFAKRSPKIAKQLKAYLESPDRNDPDLAKRLPEVITRLRPDQLRVCEAAVQMDLLQWEPAVGMSPLLGKIESIVMSIGEFGRAYSLSSSDAYVYLKKYKGLAYLEDCHEPLSCLPVESLVDDLAQVCRNNGGKLK